MDYLIIPAVMLAVLATGYWIGRRHGRAQQADDSPDVGVRGGGGKPPVKR